MIRPDRPPPFRDKESRVRRMVNREQCASFGENELEGTVAARIY